MKNLFEKRLFRDFAQRLFRGLARHQGAFTNPSALMAEEEPLRDGDL